MMEQRLLDQNEWTYDDVRIAQENVQTESTSSESSYSPNTWTTEFDYRPKSVADTFSVDFQFGNTTTEGILSFEAPGTGQQFGQMLPTHGSCEEVMNLPVPGPQWLYPCNVDPAISEAFATDIQMPENYQDQQYSATYDAIQSSALKNVSNVGTSSASFRSEGICLEPTVSLSQAGIYPDNGNVVGHLVSSNIWESPLDGTPQSLQVPGHEDRNKGLRKSYTSECPICDQSFKRRDNIKPHVWRKHPSYFASLYAMSRSTSAQSLPASTRCHRSACGETLTIDNVGGDGSLSSRNRLSLEKDFKTPNQVQCEVGCPGPSMVPQKRSLDHFLLEDTIVSDGSDCKAIPRSRMASNDTGRTLACPFQKRDPSRHQKCFALSLQRIKDVKQHLFRCHMKPEYYCAVCYVVFDTADDRDRHSRWRGCEELDSPCLPQFGGITEDQRKQLSEKSLRTMDVKQQWFQIWSVIFPDIEAPRSVYLGDCLEEMIPVLRTKWERQRSSIMARAGEMGSQQLSSAVNCAMDMFLRSLESSENETAGYGTTDKRASLVTT